MKSTILSVCTALLGTVLCARSDTAPTLTVDQLRVFYQNHCARCHGADGSARGADGKKLKGSDLTDPEEAKRLSDAAMVKAIRKGIFFGLAMPSFKDELSREDAELLVREVLRKAEKGSPIAPASRAADD
jgi:mono/diheme cytochrome c family protein